MSDFVEHRDCPVCGSKDNLAVYDDHEHCFGVDCDYHKNYSHGHSHNKNNKRETMRDKPLKALAKTFENLPARGLEAATLKKYRVTGNVPGTTIEAIFPRFDSDGVHVANQIRYEGKEFSIEGDLKGATLFGQDVFPAGGALTVTITEGYYDTLSAFQMSGSRYPFVGVMSASSAKREVVENFEYLNAFQTIVVNFDSDRYDTDGQGMKAAKAIAQLFEPGKVKILNLSMYKDASDYLVNKKGRQYVDEWYQAEVFMPDGLLVGSDQKLRKEVLEYVEPKSVPYPWDGLNRKTYGIRTSELVLLTADTGVGKTSVCKEIEYSLLTNEDLIKDNVGIGFLHLEEPKRDLAIGLMSIHRDKPYHVPDVARTQEELTEAYDAVIDTTRVVIWDHFGSNDIDVVLSKIRHMAAMGCRYVFVDHLSIIVSDQHGDERKQLDEISTKIKTLTMNLDISVFCVIHINRRGEVRGSAGPEQVANLVLRLERDVTELNPWRANITRIVITKNRKYGRTGPACYLFYDEMTGRLKELTQDEAYEFEHGGSGAGHEFDRMS